MARNNYFRLCYVILTMLREYFEKGERTDIVPIREKCGIPDKYWQNVCAMMYGDGLIDNVKIIKEWGGSIAFFSVENMMITSRGLQYLEENSLMKKAHNILKGIKEVTPGL